MNEFAEVVDVLVSPEVLGLAAGLLTSGVGAPVAIGAGVVAVVGAVFLPKGTATKLVGGIRQLLTFKRIK